MKDAQKTLRQLEQVYSRRRNIETARQAVLDRKVSAQKAKIVSLDKQRDETDAAHKTEVADLLKAAKSARHFSTLPAVLAARKVRQFETSTRLRYNILREREALEDVHEKAKAQKDVSRNAALRTEKMRLLLEAEMEVQETIREAHEEEEAAEAQACRQVRRA